MLQYPEGTSRVYDRGDRLPSGQMIRPTEGKGEGGRGAERGFAMERAAGGGERVGRIGRSNLFRKDGG